MSTHRPPPSGEESIPVPRAVLPRSVLAFLIIIGVGLAFSIVVSYGAATRANQQAEQSKQQSAAVDRRLQALEDYVAGKGAQRDSENQALNQRINDAICSVLSQLPVGLLNQVRAQYGCGAGQPDAAAEPPAAAQPSTGAPAAGGTSSSAPTVTSSRPPGAPAGSASPPSTTPPPARTTQARPTSAPATTVATPTPTRAPATTSPQSSPPAGPARGPITSLLCGLLPVCTPT